MSRLILARRVGLSVVALIVVLAVVAAVFGVSVARRSFPETGGEISVPGLTGRVTVLRGDHGVPQIYADDAHDLFRAQGFVHAQDRFFEMDLRRHSTSGRLSELVGPAGLETDRVMRVLGWRRVAEAELPTLKPETRQYLQAYADGVNAYIDSQGAPSKMALEYVVLGQEVKDYRVEQWTPADSLAWLKAMAWDLRGDYDHELTRARLASRMSIAQINELFPPYPYDKNRPILSPQDWSSSTSSAISSSASSAIPGLSTTASPALPTATPATSDADAKATSSAAAERAYAVAQRALAAVPETVGRGDGIGSNSWVVSSTKSSTGKPLLANDPHLGVSMPGIWAQVGLHCREVTASCPFDVAGYSFAGMPGVVIGHNRDIAWGMTNLDPDVSDFFLEQVRAASGTYLRDGKQVPLDVRTETIKVPGAKDEKISIRSTVHGPLLSDIAPRVREAGEGAPVNGRSSPGRYDVALSWTGLQVSQTADAIFGLNSAKDFEDFRAAAKSFAVPSQNLIYADTQGHIGYQAPGKVPVRSRYMEAAPGYWTRPGWVSAWDWKGYVPFEQMPWAYDPPQGLIVTANQAVTASGSPYLTTEWDYGFRAQRIRTLLEKADRITPALMSQIQGDTRDDFAPTLVKALLEVDLGRDSFTKDGQNLLRGWDFTNPVGRSDSAAASAYYNAVWSNLLNLTFNDELPDDLRASGGDQWRQVVSELIRPEKARSPWWDNKLTPGVTEGKAEILRRAMVDARLDLTKELGKDPDSWEWGKLHKLTFEHQALGGADMHGVVRWLFNRGPVQLPGGASIVNANAWDASKGYTVTAAPSMRMVVDLSNLDASRWVNQTGNSGHPFHDNYDDQSGAWAKNELFDWPFSEKAVREAGGDELTLVPSDS